MLIAQITDTHLGFDPDNPTEFNRKRLDQLIRLVGSLSVKPDLLIATGDLVDRGDSASYARLQNALSLCPVPICAIPGNHDDRANFISCFPDAQTADGFVQYERLIGGLRLLFLDTLEPGRHGGAYCETRARWLRDRLSEAPEVPTVIIMHHPPVDVGIDWMSTHPQEPWVARFSAALGDARNIVGILCGHVHRAISVSWQGRVVTVCPSSAPQVALDLNPIDPHVPDGRPMIVADPPGYALHKWNGRELVSHFDSADDHVMLARYDARLQPMVTSLISERPDAHRL